MRSKMVGLHTLKPNERNPRKITPDALRKLCESIERDPAFMVLRPIIIDDDGMILGGNQRFSACQKLGMKSVPAAWVRTATGLTDEERKRFILVDNAPEGMAGEWDMEILAAEWQMPELGDLGFDLDDLAASLPTNEDVDAEPQIDRAEELRKEWGVEAGQIWELGDHRMLCGDSTNADCVSALMVNDRAAACITDPPYSVNYDRSQEERGGNAGVHGHYHEGETSPDGILSFMALVPSDVMVWSYPIDRHFHALSDAYRKHGWELKKELVWVKDSFSFWMSAKYQQKHEPMMLATRKGKPIGGNVPSTATTVFEYPRPRAHDLHPTMKPIELWCELIKNHSSAAEIIYEPFSGSGTTIIACEQLGRKCRAIELSPGYVAVALQRFKDATGKTPTLEGSDS